MQNPHPFPMLPSRWRQRGAAEAETPSSSTTTSPTSPSFATSPRPPTTPIRRPTVYEAVLQYLREEGKLTDAHTILRPFYPGGDYERAEYPENGIVIDNPPFSMYSKICKFYTARHIPFFLFGPGMTIATVCTYATAVIINTGLVFENGANVRVNFASSLFPDVAIMTAPRLNDLIRACPSQNQKKELPVYETPDELLSVSDLQTICNGGIDFVVRRSECVRVRSLDLHPKRGGLFGDHFLISKAKAKAIAKAIAKAKAKAKRAIHIPLSEREQRIVARLGAR